MTNNSMNYESLSSEVGDMLMHSKYTRSYNALLAKELNKSKAAMINQIHYWTTILRDERHFREGRYWVYETYQDWQAQFPEMTIRAIQKTLLSLEEDGYVYVGNFNDKNYDRTKWYAVNYEKVKEALAKQGHKPEDVIKPDEQSSLHPDEQSSLCPDEKSSSPIPNISIPNKSLPKKSKKEWSDFDEIKNRPPDSGLKIRLHYLYGHYDSDVSKLEDVIRYFFDKYEVLKGERHEYIVLDDYFYEPTMLIGTVAYELDYANMTDIVDQYFNDFPDTVWDYRHFGTEKILRTRMYELGYGQADVDGILGKETYTPNNSNDVGSEWGL